MKDSEHSLSAGMKRKRSHKEPITISRPKISNDKIQELELRATEGPKHYNDIATLLGLACPSNPNLETNGAAVLALCRVFTRLLSTQRFRRASNTDEETVVQQWLEERYGEYTSFLLDHMSHEKSIEPRTNLKILMKLVQTEVCCQGHGQWVDGLFSSLLRVLLQASTRSGEARIVFISDYFEKFDDVQMNTLSLLP
jgi:U3 small nucleolar RNA-associated protein 19